MPVTLFRISVLILAAVVSACSNGGGSSDNGNNQSANTEPTLQLNDGDVLGGTNSVIRIPAGDDTGIVRVGSTIVRQGVLPECDSVLADSSIVAQRLVDACLLDQPACAVNFQPVDGMIEVIPPPLYAPIGLEYDLTLVDRDGSTTDPVRAVFCFGVAVNTAPVTTPDTFQLTYPSRISRGGVIYNDRCEKDDGSQGVLANDEDDEHITNSCLRAELVELPAYASNLATFRSTFGADGSFIYEAFNDLPPEDSSGLRIDSFTYRVTDGVNPVSEPVVVEIVYANSANSAPQAGDDSYSIAEDSGANTLAVLENDFDPDALPLSVVSVSNGPGNGVANIRNGVVIEYRPRAGYVGQDRFSYTVEDSGGLRVTANVTINITNVNDAPIAENDFAATNQNTPVVVRVLANDTDLEGDALAIESVANPRNGTATVTADGSITYTPDAGYSGPDAFEYTISDGTDTATATVVLDVVFVNVGPIAGADSFSLSEGESRVFNLIDNDSDSDGDVLTIVRVTDPANGSVVILEEGNVRYTADDGFSGNDAFSYTLSDGTVETTGQVSILVNSVNSAPVANADSASTAEETPVVIDVLSNDSDSDGDTLTVVSITNARSGTASINANNTVTFVPADSFSGTAGFSYVVNDGNGGTDSAAVTVQVNDTNESPAASGDSASTTENTAVVIDVLVNDSDPDGDALTVTGINNVRFGTADVNPDNTVTFTPANDFSGQGLFNYVIGDGNGGTDSAVVTVLVSDSNTNPVAVDDTRTTEADDPVSIAVLQNDSDPDGDDLTLAVVTQPANGSAAVNSAASRIVYRPAAGFSGSDSFTYQISDGNGGVAVASVIVTVTGDPTPVNAVPTAVADTAQVVQGEVVVIPVLANDTDPDGDTLTVSIDTLPSNGTATVQTDSTIVYTPVALFSGEDVFAYTIDDDNGGVASATVVVTVEAVVAVNNPPVAEDDDAQATSGQVVNFNVLANDSDPDGDSLTITITTPPENGVASVLPASVISYTPDASYDGPDTISYTIDDGNGGTDSATVSITVAPSIVAPSNQPPLAIADSVTTEQATAVTIDVLANDTDDDGDVLTMSIDTAPANGVAVIEPDNTIRYEPAADFSGTDSFVYAITDGIATAVATVSISVTADPVAVTNIEIITGESGIGENDADFTLQMPDGSTVVPVSFDRLADAWFDPAVGSWIAPARDLAAAEDGEDGPEYPAGSYIYTHNFDLSSTEGISLSGVWGSDDAITIVLNGNQLVQAPAELSNFAEQNNFTASESDFIAGTNTIIFTVDNGAGPTGLYINAVISNQ